jgi:hypothetical protein
VLSLCTSVNGETVLVVTLIQIKFSACSCNVFQKCHNAAQGLCFKPLVVVFMIALRLTKELVIILELVGVLFWLLL